MDAQLFATLQDEIWDLLKEIELHEFDYNEAEEIRGRDPTWGFYAFITELTCWKRFPRPWIISLK
jgi:hypothetical protein